MSIGAIDGFSEVVEWKIPDFFSIDAGKQSPTQSPRFSLAGGTWQLLLYPQHDGHLSTILFLVNSETASKTVTYTLGLKKSDGLVEEVERDLHYTYRYRWGYGKSIALWKYDDLRKRKSELMHSGALTVTCRIERAASTAEEIAPNQEEVCSQQTTLVELETLSSDFSDLLSSDRKYDVTVNVQGKQFRAHRTVLAARSPVFRAMYEHDTAEAKTGLLTIPDCDPGTFDTFLGYLYTGKMETVSFGTAYQLYATSEKYDVQRLKSFCADHLAQNLTTENVCNVIILADQYGDDRLMSLAQDYFNKNSYKIFLTSEWNVLLNNKRLTSKLLKGMAEAALKIP